MDEQPKRLHQRFYTLDAIPDLTLSKYSALGYSNPKDVLDQQRAFWRQIERRGSLMNETYQLIYAYDPLQPLGKRLRLLFRIISSGNFEFADETIRFGPLGSYFDLYPCCDSNQEVTDILNRTYQYKAHLLKGEHFLSPLSAVDNTRYYSVSQWKSSDSARLYSMLQLMSTINQPCAYCVQIASGESLQALRPVLEQFIKALRDKIQQPRSLNEKGIINKPKDENARDVMKEYEEILDDLNSLPHFLVDVQALADSAELARYLLDAAAADALEEGIHRTVSYAEETNVCLERITQQFQSCANENAPDQLACLPHLYSVDELSAFAAFPTLYAGEHIGIPKETVPSLEESGLELGLDENGYTVRFPLKNLAKHVFIAGVPGSGKTNSMMHLITQMHTKYDLDFLLFEPAKHEYSALTTVPGMEDVEIYTPGSVKFPLHINPFEFPVGMVLSEHIHRLMEIFSGSFELFPPMPFLLDNALDEVYRKHGWHYSMVNRGQLSYPTMSELYKTLEIMVENTGFDGELRGNLRTSLQMRIGSLLRREMGDVFDVPSSTVAPEDWIHHSAILEMESMGKNAANFLTLLLSTLIRETLAVIDYNPLPDHRPRHVMLFEEAHNLIGPDSEPKSSDMVDPKVTATAYIADMLAEVRALGESIVIADQLPTAMAPKILKNSSLKIALRIVAQDDKELIGSTMSANDMQLERMGVFTPGHALINYEPLLKPFEVKIPEFVLSNPSTDADKLLTVCLCHTQYRNELTSSMQIMLKKWETWRIRILKDVATYETNVNRWIRSYKDEKVVSPSNAALRKTIVEEKENLFLNLENLFSNIVSYQQQIESIADILKNSTSVQDKNFEASFEEVESILPSIYELFALCAKKRTESHELTGIPELSTSLRNMKNTELREEFRRKLQFFSPKGKDIQ